MAEIKDFVQGFIGAIIGLVIGVALMPVITGTIADANLTGTEATIVALIPLMVAVSLLLYSLRSMS